MGINRKATFENGFDNWQETHFEIVAAIIMALEVDGSVPNLVQDANGRGGLWELAEEWTNEFETKNKGRVWDGQFYDEIDAFVGKKFTQG